jgi:DNA phosphorothioation-associated putative methyltransferase
MSAPLRYVVGKGVHKLRVIPKRLSLPLYGAINCEMMISVQRKKTAIKRLNLSRPIRLALEDGFLSQPHTFFDYGCGRGDDIAGLRKQGIAANGWDPLHRPDGRRLAADVVNLGYVINVIEDPAERIHALQDAWLLTKKLLIVSARLSLEANRSGLCSPYSDGCVTSRGTFQKYYDQQELGSWIDDVLNVQSLAIAPGVFYVFRDSELRQSFDASRYRRKTAIPRQRFSDVIFDLHRDLFDVLTGFVVTRGRLPDESEMAVANLIREKVGSLQRAFAIIRKVTGAEQWALIREERSQDLLVYLALSRFAGRPRFSQLPRDLQLDVRAFFRNYRKACELADQLLFSAGSKEVISQACGTSSVGKRLPDALYLHVSALPVLPSVLRVYEGCARAYIGSVENANVIKLKISKPQISYLYYPDFEKTAHPALAGSLVVPLNTFRIKYTEYFESVNPFILHRKETLLAQNHPLRERFERLTRQEETHGLYEHPELIGTKEGWEKALNLKGLTHSGHRLVKKPATVPFDGGIHSEDLCEEP